MVRSLLATVMMITAVAPAAATMRRPRTASPGATGTLVNRTGR